MNHAVRDLLTTTLIQLSISAADNARSKAYLHGIRLEDCRDPVRRATIMRQNGVEHGEQQADQTKRLLAVSAQADRFPNHRIMQHCMSPELLFRGNDVCK
jgi:hypothetical protein